MEFAYPELIPSIHKNPTYNILCGPTIVQHNTRNTGAISGTRVICTNLTTIYDKTCIPCVFTHDSDLSHTYTLYGVDIHTL